MADTPDEHAGGTPLNERIVELLVYVPAGLAATVVEELPKLAERGREQLGLQVSSARAIGKFAVEMGADELRRRSTGLLHHHRHRGGSAPPSNPVRRSDPVGPSPAVVSTTSAPTASPPPTTGPRPSGGNGHVPAVSTLSIPGFAGGPATRRPQPHRAGVGAGLRGLDAGPADHPQSGGPAAR